jgi:hypothetical protein
MLAAGLSALEYMYSRVRIVFSSVIGVGPRSWRSSLMTRSGFVRYLMVPV